jgi:hypothetical protein
MGNNITYHLIKDFHAKLELLFISSQISAGKMSGQKKKPGNIVSIVFSQPIPFLFVPSMSH